MRILRGRIRALSLLRRLETSFLTVKVGATGENKLRLTCDIAK